MEKIILGAGCFWGVEEAFRLTTGVAATEVGYCGGQSENPTYKEVCTGTTGHAEVIQVEFDPNIISYQKILNVFWDIHNPTTLNKQGPDVGSQYRSCIFYFNEEQQKLALTSKEGFDKTLKYSNPAVTTIEMVPIFYKAEDYHQKYFMKQGGGTCRL